MKTWKTWTTLELRRLEALRCEGRTSPDIAAILSRTVASVRNRVRTEGFTRAISTRWLEILCRPHTIASAAAEAGTTKWAVKQAKRRLRLAGFDVPDAMKAGVA